MKALVMACSTGGGHMACAKAVCKALESKDWQTTLMDPYDLASHTLASQVGNVYVDLVQFSARLFGDVYKIGQIYEYLEHKFDLPDPVMDVQKRMAARLGAWLKEHPVDLIVCTHPYPAFMVSLLKLRHFPVPASIMVATDYTCIPFESDTRCEWMVIPSRALMDTFVKAGVPFHQLVPTGIPCDPAFETSISRETAARLTNMDPQYRYILMAGGSMGSKTLSSTILQVQNWVHTQENTHLIVVCGSNDTLRQQLTALQDPLLHATGFTDQMRAYLALCEVFVTKPGGLSITEAAAAGVPMILCDPIPGCETKNAAYFEAYGMALYAREPREILEALSSLWPDSPEGRKRRNAMVLAQKTFLPHDSASNLCDFAWQAMYLHARNQRPAEDDAV